MKKAKPWVTRGRKIYGTWCVHQFQIKDAIKAARIEVTKAYKQYAEEPKTSQRRWGFDLELVLILFKLAGLPGAASERPHRSNPAFFISSSQTT